MPQIVPADRLTEVPLERLPDKCQWTSQPPAALAELVELVERGTLGQDAGVTGGIKVARAASQQGFPGPAFARVTPKR